MVVVSLVIPTTHLHPGLTYHVCLREDAGVWHSQQHTLTLPQPGLALVTPYHGDTQDTEDTVDHGNSAVMQRKNFPDPWQNVVHRQRRSGQEPDEVLDSASPLRFGMERSQSDTRITAMLLAGVTSHNTYLAEGGITVYDMEEFSLILSGTNLESITAVKFTTVNNTYGGDCHSTDSFHTSDTFTDFEDMDSPGLRSLIVPGLQYWTDQRTYYICISTDQPEAAGNYRFMHQGGEKTLLIYMDKQLLPIWVMICMIAFLLCMSGLFSGLNLGLMSLDQTELKIVQNTGTDKEKRYAEAIMPIRAMGNFLLCSILLGNVLVNNTLTILLDTLTGGGGTVAVVGATLGIVVFGEIIPQAICSRHGLAVGARTIFLTKFFMLLTAPLSYPISKILDCVLGSEIGTVYNKQRLMELLKVTEPYSGLERDEINIVTGALVLKQKAVKDVMTNLDDCYMLPVDAKLDFDTISEIKEQGYSRIPVYKGTRTNVVHILFAKDLLFVDPDDEKPIEEICKFYRNDVNFVYSDTILTDMFDEFKSGEKGHLALVQEVNNDGEADPFYETVGLVTLEDIIEEIIQQEIVDETDVIIDNKTKKKRKRERYKKDAEFKMFQGARHTVTITPHATMAVLQFLTTSVRPFSPEFISDRILSKLLSMDVFRELKIHKESKEARNNNDEKSDGKSAVLMTKGKPCNFFIMIIEGKVEVTIGKEERKFQDGPFSFYGEQMLEQTWAMMNPSSPVVNSSRGINPSQSMQSSVSQDVRSAPHLKKTNTQLQLNENVGSSKRSTTTTNGEAGTPPVGQKNWIPDYTLKAVTDLIYLKVRRNTYMVAIKASRMTNMSSDQMTETDLSDALAKVIENDQDDEFGRTPSIRSPDKGWENGLGQSHTELSGADFRRESIRSSLSAMKHKLLGGQSMLGGRSSSTSIDRSGVTDRKDDLVDGMANPALVGDDREMSSSIESGTNMWKEKNNGAGPMFLPLGTGVKRGDTVSALPPLQRDVSDPLQHCRNSMAMVDLEAGQMGGGGLGTSVIAGKARDQEQSQSSSPSDRTSLLHTDHPVS